MSVLDWARAWGISLGADPQEVATMFEGKGGIESLGAARVRLDFNPSKDDLVDRLKRKSAELIDLCGAIAKPGEYGEVARCVALAQTAYEEAAMWAVKAATAKR